MNAWQKLKWLILSGITETVSEQPVNRTRAMPTAPQMAQPEPAAQSSSSDTAQTLATQAQTLDDLYRLRDSFDGCPLKKTASHTINGFGAKSPTVLCYLGTPDTADDKAGHLLNGPTGELFYKMIGAIGLDINHNTYVSTLIPWRPPGNRPPTEAELAICRPFWDREIDLLHPKFILLFGSDVSAAILGINALSKARGHWHTCHDIPTLVTLSPATLLKLPAQKKQAWDDLQFFKTGLSSS